MSSNTIVQPWVRAATEQPGAVKVKEIAALIKQADDEWIHCRDNPNRAHETRFEARNGTVVIIRYPDMEPSSYVASFGEVALLNKLYPNGLNVPIQELRWRKRSYQFEAGERTTYTGELVSTFELHFDLSF